MDLNGIDCREHGQGCLHCFPIPSTPQNDYTAGIDHASIQGACKRIRFGNDIHHMNWKFGNSCSVNAELNKWSVHSRRHLWLSVCTLINASMSLCTYLNAFVLLAWMNTRGQLRVNFLIFFPLLKLAIFFGIFFLRLLTFLLTVTLLSGNRDFYSFWIFFLFSS